jgi:mannose-6-phosphate isomerase-like protein (cupin superfamily)
LVEKFCVFQKHNFFARELPVKMLHSGNMQTDVAENDRPLRVLYTDAQMQLAVETVPVNQSVKREVHKTQSQFIRVEQGRALVKIFDDAQSDRHEHVVLVAGGQDWVIVPAGRWHEVQNDGKGVMKFYTVYAPPVH